MGSRVEEVEYLGLGFLRCLAGRPVGFPLADLAGEMVFTGSGRAALRIILEQCVNRGILVDRNDEVVVPQWLCQSVMNTLHRFCHPVLTPGPRTKAVLAYHQYGFPQQIGEIRSFCSRNNIFLIEDCAHAYQSFVRGQRLGTFGDAALFSFSKFFPSILGGALVASDETLLSFARERLKESRYSHLVYASRLFFELARGGVFERCASDIQEMVYAKTDGAFRVKDLSLRAVGRQLAGRALERRKANYLYVCDHFHDRPEYFAGLEREGVVPYVLPLFAQEPALSRIAQALLANGFYSGVYHFDVKRNVLDPAFRRCVWVPVHQGLSAADLQKICGVIRRAG